MVGRLVIQGFESYAPYQPIYQPAGDGSYEDILVSVDDAAQVVRAFFARKGAKKIVVDADQERAEAEFQAGVSSWAGRWSTGDWVAVGMAVACSLLCLAAPLLTEHTFDSTLAALAAELMPFPSEWANNFRIVHRDRVSLSKENDTQHES